MNRYLVGKKKVSAESARHAVKYYCLTNSFKNGFPQFVTCLKSGKRNEVIGICERTALGVFIEDELGKQYRSDDDGVIWLTNQELKKIQKLLVV